MNTDLIEFECPVCGGEKINEIREHDGIMGPGGHSWVTGYQCRSCSVRFGRIPIKNNKEVKFKKICAGAIIPKYATPGSSGFDLHCCHPVIIDPLETVLVPTGLTCSIPKGTELQIRARSGLAIHVPGYLIKNGIGTVDEDYRGELRIPIHNMSHTQSIEFEAGDRIAQGIICPVIRCEIVEVDELDETERGSGGFGSTGT